MKTLQDTRVRRRLMSVWNSISPRRRQIALADSGSTPVDGRAPIANHESGVDKSAVAQYWSEAQRTQNPFGPEVYWLANPTVHRRYQQKASQGASTEGWHFYCVRKYLGSRMPVGRMLSIGCGAGELELDLARINAFRACDAWDLAVDSIARATQIAAKKQIAGLTFAVQDAETALIPSNTYDAAWFNMSLHHIEKLESTLGNIAAALKPGGYLFLNEYVGPNRFDFSAREKEIMSAVYRLLPDKYRRSFAQANRGEVIETASFPNPVDVAAADPSESIRSGDIIECVRAHFDIVELNPCGGTLLQFLLGNIMGNFREDDSTSLRVLQMLFEIEDTLIEVDEIPSHFATMIARPKRQ